MMNKQLILAFATIGICIAIPAIRQKREAWEFAADAESIIGNYQTTFSCAGLKYGYYADQDNDCKVFHICNPITLADGTEQMDWYSFFCPNQTVFNQFSLTCAHPDEAVPCGMSPDMYYLLDRLGNPEENFHREEDVNTYNDVLRSAYGSRSGSASARSAAPEEKTQ